MKENNLPRKIVSLGILLLIITAFSRSEDRFSVTGYYKNFSIFFSMPANKFQDTTVVQPDLGAVNNRIRLTMDFHPWDSVSFQCAYDLSARIQDPQLFDEEAFFGLTSLPEYRWDDLWDRLYPRREEAVSSFGLFQNLDRFYMTLSTDFADVFIGRQPIAWGSARFINPTDIIAPFAFNELDKEERLGVDAFRLRIPLGMMDELDLGFVAGNHLKSDNNAFFLRAKTYQIQTDLSVILVGFRKHLLLGLDVARSIGGAGFWFESAYVIAECFREKKDPKEKNYFRASIGVDYSLSRKTYGFVEYHFSSAGKNQAEKYLDLLQSSAFRDGSVYLLGKHYLNIGSTYQLRPLIPLTGMIILNLSDGSMVLSPTLEYNIAQNIYLAAGGYIGLGKNPELAVDPLNPLPYFFQSEFGAYPDMIYTSFRIYF